MRHFGVKHKFCTQTLGVDKGYKNQVSILICRGRTGILKSLKCHAVKALLCYWQSTTVNLTHCQNWHKSGPKAIRSHVLIPSFEFLKSLHVVFMKGSNLFDSLGDWSPVFIYRTGTAWAAAVFSFHTFPTTVPQPWPGRSTSRGERGTRPHIHWELGLSRTASKGPTRACGSPDFNESSCPVSPGKPDRLLSRRQLNSHWIETATVSDQERI